KKALAADLDRWEKEALAAPGKAAQVHVLEIADFHSAAGAPHKGLDDRSVLLVDDPPEKDTYVVTAHTDLKGITGFKLEALTHPSLPGQGPGRGDADRRGRLRAPLRRGRDGEAVEHEVGPEPAAPVRLVKA